MSVLDVSGGMGRMGRRIFLLSSLLLTCLIPMGAMAQTDLHTVIAELDARQKSMVANADVNGLAALAHPDLKINAPTNRVLTRDQFLASIRSGKISAEAFERTVESISITGNVAVVVGSELFTPTAMSELGKTYGVHPLNRRYTNVYVLESGKWLWLARHANVVVDLPHPAS